VDRPGWIHPGIPATGKAFEMEAMYIVRVNDQGQIAERWGVVDTIATMAQLGLLPSPGNVGPA
jgi:predicted ester cyclase